MNLEGITLNEIHLSQKDSYYMIHYSEVPKIVKFIQIGNRMVVARVGGRWE